MKPTACRSLLKTRYLAFLFGCLCTAFPTVALSNVPHIVFGEISTQADDPPDPSNLELYAYRHQSPAEIIDSTSVGSGYGLMSSGGGWFWLELGNLPSAWNEGESFRIIAIDNGLSLSGSLDIVLNSQGVQQTPKLVLLPGDNVGPITDQVRANGASPAEVEAGSSSVSITAIVMDALTGGGNIQSAQCFVDAEPDPGAGDPMNPADGTFDSPQEDVSLELDASSWTEGEEHVVHVAGQDVVGNWGAPQSLVITVIQGQEAVRGDIDHDGDVDRDDLNIILAARNTPADGPDDERDLDGDGMITGLDSRILVTLCTRARCATQ